jgi:opacity protein-like surface antigen
MKKYIIFIFAFANAQITITPFVQGDLAHVANFSDPDNSGEDPKFSYSLGVGINYAFSKKWELKSGLTFQDMGNKWETNLYVTSGVNPIDKIAQRVHYQFLSIPIQLQYNFNTNKKTTPFVALGTSLNWNVNNIGYYNTFYRGEPVLELKGDIQDIRQFNLGANLNTGIKQQLTEKLNLNVFISGNLLLLKTSKDAFDNARHFNVGLGLGLGYTIQ